MDDDLRASLTAARAQVKSALGVLRSTSQFLADLDEKLELADPQPGGTGYVSNGHHTHTAQQVRYTVETP